MACFGIHVQQESEIYLSPRNHDGLPSPHQCFGGQSLKAAELDCCSEVRSKKSLLTNQRNRHYQKSGAINQNIRAEESSLSCHHPAPSCPVLSLSCSVLSNICRTVIQPALLDLSQGLGGREFFFFCDEMNVSVGLVETLKSRSRHASLSRLQFFSNCSQERKYVHFFLHIIN